MAATSEPGSLVFTIFDQLISAIKSSRPPETQKGFTSGFVYSQLVLGMMVDPNDYLNPWSPMGGSSLQDGVAAFNNTGAPPVPPPPAGTPAATSPPAPPPPDPKFQRAMRAAYNTSRLVDQMIQVTNNDVYVEYPTDRHVSFEYEEVINAMQPLPPPPIPDNLKQAVEAARKVIWVEQDDGTHAPTPLYSEYQTLQLAYGQAKGTFIAAQTSYLNNPLKADSWPLVSSSYQMAVDQAWDNWRSAGADKIEAALATVKSVGVNLDAAMIAKARQIMDVWKLGLSGAPDGGTPYAQVFPTAWCDPTADNIGWQKLHIEQDDYHAQSQSNSGSGWWNNFQSHSSSSSGGGAIGFGFFVAGAEGGSASSDTLAASQNWSWSNGAFHNDASNLTIDLEYGLVTIDRPWLVSDLFYLQNWYLTGYKKNAISDGTINGQVGDKDKLLPMLPKQFLVIRNMKISAEDWGSDSHFLQSTYNSAKSQGHTSSGHVSGGGGFSLGFINVGGTASHGWSDSSASASGAGVSSSQSDYGWKFDGQSLEIRGAQIIAWLSDIVPACPAGDAPNLPH